MSGYTGSEIQRTTCQVYWPAGNQRDCLLPEGATLNLSEVIILTTVFSLSIKCGTENQIIGNNWWIILYINWQIQVCIPVFLIKICYCLPVENMCIRVAKSQISSKMRQVSVILIFQVITIRIFGYKNCNSVCTWSQVCGYVIFGRFLGAFVIADFIPVYPHKWCGMLSFPSWGISLSLSMTKGW